MVTQARALLFSPFLHCTLLHRNSISIAFGNSKVMRGNVGTARSVEGQLLVPDTLAGCSQDSEVRDDVEGYLALNVILCR